MSLIFPASVDASNTVTVLSVGDGYYLVTFFTNGLFTTGWSWTVNEPVKIEQIYALNIAPGAGDDARCNIYISGTAVQTLFYQWAYVADVAKQRVFSDIRFASGLVLPENTILGISHTCAAATSQVRSSILIRDLSVQSVQEESHRGCGIVNWLNGECIRSGST